MSAPTGNGLPQRLKPMRVALVAASQSLAHLGPAVRHLVVGLLDEPMHVSLLCPEGADTSYVPDPPVQVIRYGSLRLPFIRGRTLDALARRVGRGGVAVLHALDAGALPLTRRLAERCDLGYVASVLSLKSGLHVTGRRCRAVLAASEPIRRALIETRAAPGELVSLLPPAVHRVRKATCFINARHSPAIVAAGRLAAREHFAAVLEAFARVRARRSQCALFIVGDGPGESQLRRLADDLALMADLTFVQPRDAVLLADIVRAADVFISPVPSDRVEIDLLAAMAAGGPVVVAGAAAADFVLNGHTALTYAPTDADDLAGRLDRLLDDRAWARQLAENALAHLREHHSPAKAAARLAELYRGIVARERSAAGRAG